MSNAMISAAIDRKRGELVAILTRPMPEKRPSHMSRMWAANREHAIRRLAKLDTGDYYASDAGGHIEEWHERFEGDADFGTGWPANPMPRF